MDQEWAWQPMRRKEGEPVPQTLVPVLFVPGCCTQPPLAIFRAPPPSSVSFRLAHRPSCPAVCPPAVHSRLLLLPRERCGRAPAAAWARSRLPPSACVDFLQRARGSPVHALIYCPHTSAVRPVRGINVARRQQFYSPPFCRFVFFHH